MGCLDAAEDSSKVNRREVMKAFGLAAVGAVFARVGGLAFVKPPTQSVGDAWFDTRSNTLRRWDGIKWYESDYGPVRVTGTGPKMTEAKLGDLLQKAWSDGEVPIDLGLIDVTVVPVPMEDEL